MLWRTGESNTSPSDVEVHAGDLEAPEVDRPMWQRLDEQERSAGRRTGLTRVTMTSITDLLRVAGQG